MCLYRDARITESPFSLCSSLFFLWFCCRIVMSLNIWQFQSLDMRMCWALEWLLWASKFTFFFPLFHSWKLWSLIGHSSEQSQLFEVLKKKIQSDNTFIGRLIKNLFFYKESILEIESLLNLFSWSARTQTNKQFSLGLSEQWTCDEKFM